MRTWRFLPIRVARGHGASRQPRPLDTSLITARLVTAVASLCAPSRTITWRDPGCRKSVRATLRLRAWRAGPYLRKPYTQQRVGLVALITACGVGKKTFGNCDENLGFSITDP